MDQPVVDALSQTVLVKFRVSTRESSDTILDLQEILPFPRLRGTVAAVGSGFLSPSSPE
jgi:hypothetical protein